MHKTDFFQNQISSSWFTLVTSQLTVMEVKFLCCETWILGWNPSDFYSEPCWDKHTYIMEFKTNVSLTKPNRDVLARFCLTSCHNLHAISPDNLSSSPKNNSWSSWQMPASQSMTAWEFMRLPLWYLPSEKNKSFAYERLDGGIER